MDKYIQNNINQQSIILILSMFYIYFLSDLFTVINEGPTLKLVIRLGIPVWGKLGVLLIEKIQKYNVDLREWWSQTVSTPLIVAYIFKFIKWIYDNGIHQTWDLSMKYGLHSIFLFVVGKILYNFIFYFYYSYTYLFFSLLCSYGVYMRFDTSKTALVTLSGKCVEMGTGILISEQLHLIDDWKDYCIKNKNTWLSYIIRLVIGYHGSTDIDGEEMAKEISEYVGVSHIECENLYKKSLVKKGLTIMETSKNIYAKISYPFSSCNKISDKDEEDDEDYNIKKFELKIDPKIEVKIEHKE
jgi:hypothetical protein